MPNRKYKKLSDTELIHFINMLKEGEKQLIDLDKKARVIESCSELDRKYGIQLNPKQFVYRIKLLRKRYAFEKLTMARTGNASKWNLYKHVDELFGDDDSKTENHLTYNPANKPKIREARDLFRGTQKKYFELCQKEATELHYVIKKSIESQNHLNTLLRILCSQDKIENNNYN